MNISRIYVLQMGIISVLLLSSLTLNSKENHSSELGFAEHLYSSGDYYNAVTEFKRSLFNNPDYKNSYAVYYKLSLAQLHDNKYLAATTTLDNMLRNPLNEDLEYKVRVQRALIYMKQGFTALARTHLDKLSENGGNQEKIAYYKTWTYILEADWDNALKTLGCSESDMQQDAISVPITNLNKKLAHLQTISYRSPARARLLSALIPGAGEIYNQDYHKGFIAFLINGGFAYWTYRALVDKQYITAFIITSSGWSRFYFGSQYNANHAAQKYNDKLKTSYVTDLAQKHSFFDNFFQP